MLYKDFIKNLKECPFCKLSGNQIVKENTHSYMVLSIAPYHKHHLLIIPKRHFEKILEATPEEDTDTLSLTRDGILLLNKLGYKNYVVLVREGDKETAKSVEHIHYHVIPDTPIGMIEGQGDRVVLTKSEMGEILNDFKKVLTLK